MRPAEMFSAACDSAACKALCTDAEAAGCKPAGLTDCKSMFQLRRISTVLQTQADAETLQVAGALKEKSVRIGQRDFEKMDAITRTKLRRNAKIDRDHVSYFWIAADGLAILQKQDRFPARWNLDRPGATASEIRSTRFAPGGQPVVSSGWVAQRFPPASLRLLLDFC